MRAGSPREAVPSQMRYIGPSLHSSDRTDWEWDRFLGNWDPTRLPTNISGPAVMSANVRCAQKTQCITPEENAAACQSVARTWHTRNKTPPAPSITSAENSTQLYKL